MACGVLQISDLGVINETLAPQSRSLRWKSDAKNRRVYDTIVRIKTAELNHWNVLRMFALSAEQSNRA
jgi:hypothetical protein